MIIRLDIKNARIIAKIHATTLKDDFLPALGLDFLTAFYKGLFVNKGVLIFGDKQQNQITGFIVGTDNMRLLFKKVLKENFFSLSLYLFFALLRKPNLILKVAETFLYPNKDLGPKAELVVIAVKKEYQGKGLGKKLVRYLEKNFLQSKIKEYKLTVHADKNAVKFYEKLRFKKIGKFKLYQKNWFIYSKKI